MVGKYIQLPDAYLSVIEALHHAGVANGRRVNIELIDGEELDVENIDEVLGGADGILVPGGFGQRGFEGKLAAANYARTHKIPFLGICLGLQVAVCEYARNVLGWADAHSAEFSESTQHPVIDLMPDQAGITDMGGTMRLGSYPCVVKEGTLADAHSAEFSESTQHPVIDLMPDQAGITDMGGTMRLGSYPCVVKEGTLAAEAYGEPLIEERHRHRFEVNNAFRPAIEEAGLVVSGASPNGQLVEMVELPRSVHPWYVAGQFHPEFKSRPTRPHPLFRDFIAASCR